MADFPYITGPLVAHGVRSAEDYRASHARTVRKLCAMPQSPVTSPDPQPAAVLGTPEINGGRWIVLCACNNGPSAHPDWDLALCYECGAVHQGMTWPSPELRAQIEAVLLCRRTTHRNWTTETVAELIAENRAHGDRVPAELDALYPPPPPEPEPPAESEAS